MNPLRKQAWSEGKLHFYTGEPCKNGHFAKRYVSTGGCTECLTPLKRRQNSFSKDLAPYACPTLWIRKNATPEELQALALYLQRCVDSFFAEARPNEPAPFSGPPT